MEEQHAPPPGNLSQSTFILRARAVLPVSRPVLENGAVLVSGNRIRAVGSWNELSSQPHAHVIDLGDAVLMPGLVNAHCHLDYTDMAGRLPPQKRFTDWIKLMLATKAEWIYTEFAESWLHGAQMLVRSGTTTVADYEAVPELLPDLWSTTPMRVLSFLEMTGVKSRCNPQAILNEALARVDELHDARSFASLAPHAPYSTVPELIRISAEAARDRGLPLSIHLSESQQEFEMFCDARGEMFEWLQRNERDLSDCGHGSPVRQLANLGALGPNLLAVHVNYLAPGDAQLLAKHESHVVHCPRSHAYFQHAPFPYRELTEAGVNICLGTDSLATVYKTRRDTVELSLFDEASSFVARNPDVSPDRVVQMMTANGARALGMAGQVGELREDALADLIAIPFNGDVSNAAEAVVRHRGPVTASMINGQWAISAPTS